MAPSRSSGYVDPGWEHGVAQDEKKKKVKCKYCGKIVSGGIYRLKQHLGRVTGEVTYCDKAPEEVCLRMKENLEHARAHKRTRQSEDYEQAYLNFQSNDDEEDKEHDWFKTKGKQMVDDAKVSYSTPLRSSGYVDPGWEHGVPQDERKKKVKCNYCEKVVSGGINRFKQHLARIPGEVAPCKNTPEEVYLKIKENMKWHRAGKRHSQPDSTELSAFSTFSQNDFEDDELEEDAIHLTDKRRLKVVDQRLGRNFRRNFKGMSISNAPELVPKKSRLSPGFARMQSSQALVSSKQRKVNTGSDEVSRKEVFSAICKFFYHAGVPLQAANSLYFSKMLEMVGKYGPGLTCLPSQLVAANTLQEEIATIKGYIVECKSSWEVTGCSIMADSWTDTEGRTLINFLVSCPRGVYFDSSVDATSIVDDAYSLFKLLDKLVEEVGEENVIQVITENTPAYKAAGKMLEEKRKNLFWTPCASYCVDRVLEDFSKLGIVSECLEKGQRVTRFIYNQSWLLNLMKKEYTQGQELLKPAVTRYASSFATLHNLVDHKTDLKRMFQSNKWNSSRMSKSVAGKEVEKIVLSASFWKKVRYVRKSVDPVMQVLQMIEGECCSLPYIYSYMYRAKLAVKSIHADDVRKYGAFWRVIDYHWSTLFHHPLYVAAYFFNPSYRYRPDFSAHSELVRGVNECVVRLEPDNIRRISALMQVADYTSAKVNFVTDSAISTRTDLHPAQWWQQHGISCLELQQVAVRILSHTCSSFGCEHNWSIYDVVHSQRHSHVARKNLNDLVYVHYNLRLREKQLRVMSGDSVPIDSVMAEQLLEDWIVEVDKRILQKDEETLYFEDGTASEDDYQNQYSEDEDRIEEHMKESDAAMMYTDIQCMDTVPASAVDATDNEADLDFYDDDLSD